MTRGQTNRQQVRGERASSAAGGVLRWCARLLGLFVVVVLVVGLGTGVRDPEPEVRAYSASEQAQLDAEHRFRALAGDARAAASATPEAAEQLTAVAADLDVQADAVALPRSPAGTGDGTPDAGAAHVGAEAATSDPAPTATTPPADAALVLSMLRESALRSLHDAVDAEPGAGRVLASAGTNQWRQAVVLGQALGTDPRLPVPDAVSAVELAEGSGLFALDGAKASGDGADAADQECAGTPLGPDADRRALLTAKTAEDRARYGYEVAAALLEDPAGALDGAARHRAAAEAAAARLSAACEPAAPAPAGFTIDPAFRTDPPGALRQLEQDHVALYGSLVSSVSPAARAWAVTCLNAAVQRSIGAGAVLAPLPGLEEAVPEPGRPTEATEQPGG